MRYSSLSAVSLSCLLLAACDKDPSAASTGPDVRYAQTTAAACDSRTARDISQQQNALFSRAVLTAARDTFAPVLSHCSSNLTQAREEMMRYVQLTIDMYKAGNVDQPRLGTKEAALVAHWNSTFVYVGYDAPDVNVAVFGTEGAIGVITPSTVNREIAALHAAVTVPSQSGPGRLISIYPLTHAACLIGTNLIQSGPCFDFAAHPAAPAFTEVKVGICQPVDADDAIQGNLPALGHRQDAGNTTITGPTGIYPTFCPHDHFDTGSWTGGFGDMATRLAWLAGKALGVQTAYAANGGLGGLDTDLSSPFGAVDLLVFKATFTNDAIGTTPVTPDVGTWDTPIITNPGSIEVQPSLGLLNTRPVVLRQAGGNCGPACGGLQLRGRLASAGPLAKDGKYHVEWTSVQDFSSVKGAPFILASDTGAVIATVSYSTVASTNILSFNGVPFGTWERYVPLHFEIEVDLDAGTTVLRVENDSVAAGTFTAPDFSTIAADFRGIDSGVMGWDDIFVRRRSDH